LAKDDHCSIASRYENQKRLSSGDGWQCAFLPAASAKSGPAESRNHDFPGDNNAKNWVQAAIAGNLVCV
jgi:hypothetical protein